MNFAPQFATAVESDGDGSLWLLLSGPASAVGTYWLIYRYYRNVDKSHGYEQETEIESQPITGADVKVGERNGTKDSSIQGDNKQSHRSRVKRLP
ncbi:MAG: hypothetical protein GX678_03450 [Actinomycetales bacterium]|nr:hypothetical protein [Actinomycetales bacterium]